MPPVNYLSRAAKRGAFRFPADTLFFHLGRMSHISASCVSCGLCEDACPVDIPVEELARALAALGAHVTVENIREDIAAGAPVNADGTLNLVHYAAWLAGETRLGD